MFIETKNAIFDGDKIRCITLDELQDYPRGHQGYWPEKEYLIRLYFIDEADKSLTIQGGVRTINTGGFQSSKSEVGSIFSNVAVIRFSSKEERDAEYQDIKRQILK